MTKWIITAIIFRVSYVGRFESLGFSDKIKHLPDFVVQERGARPELEPIVRHALRAIANPGVQDSIDSSRLCFFDDIVNPGTLVYFDSCIAPIDVNQCFDERGRLHRASSLPSLQSPRTKSERSWIQKGLEALKVLGYDRENAENKKALVSALIQAVANCVNYTALTGIPHWFFGLAGAAGIEDFSAATREYQLQEPYDNLIKSFNVENERLQEEYEERLLNNSYPDLDELAALFERKPKLLDELVGDPAIPQTRRESLLSKYSPEYLSFCLRPAPNGNNLPQAARMMVASIKEKSQAQPSKLDRVLGITASYFDRLRLREISKCHFFDRKGLELVLSTDHKPDSQTDLSDRDIRDIFPILQKFTTEMVDESDLEFLYSYGTRLLPLIEDVFKSKEGSTYRSDTLKDLYFLLEIRKILHSGTLGLDS